MGARGSRMLFAGDSLEKNMLEELRRNVGLADH